MSGVIVNVLLSLLLAALPLAGACTNQGGMADAAALIKPNPASTPTAAAARAGIFTLELTRPVTHQYRPSDNIEVRVFADQPGGIENDIGQQSQTLQAGERTISLGRVPGPGIHFTRAVVGGDTFTHAFLVLPAGGGNFTVSLIAEKFATVEIPQAQQSLFRKFMGNLSVPKLGAAASAVTPGWLTQNGQNFVVTAAKGAVLAFSGLGFVAVMLNREIARELAGLVFDYIVTVMARAADDLVKEGKLTSPEGAAVKKVLQLINGVAQTALSDNLFAKVVSAAQGVNGVINVQDPEGEMLGKVSGDFAKKIHVFIELRPK
jgi:hypothetical protein